MKESKQERYLQLIKKGHKELQEGEWEKAGDTFGKALEDKDESPARNNLAYAYYMQGRLEKALDILKPIMAPDVVSPFGRALAAIIYFELEHKTEALACLQQAIGQFDQFRNSPSKAGFEPRSFWEYTVLVKRAAGMLGEHQIVLDLHRKWQAHYQSPEDLFQVGVAFFNQGYPDRASKTWSRIRSRAWEFLQGYVETAGYVSRGLVPNFSLPYLPPDFDSTLQSDCVTDGGLRMLLLAQLFDLTKSDDFKEQLVVALCKTPDEWGVEFGETILQSNSVPMAWKFAALEALTHLGFYQEGESVSIMVDGEIREVHLEEKAIFPATPEQMKELQKIRELLYAEKHAEALGLLEGLLAKDDASLESLEMLGMLYAVLGEDEKAVEIAEMFVGLAAELESPVPYIVATKIYLQLEDYAQALRQFNKIEKSKLPKGLHARYKELREAL